MSLVGITERGDASYYEDWVDWVCKKNNPAILITKNAPLLFRKHPDIFFHNVIVHVTCTGMGGTILEPNVPPHQEILDWLRKRPDTVLNKMVLRCDPICPPLFAHSTKNFDSEKYFFNVVEILKAAKDLNMRARVSFLDMYPHVNQRFHNLGIYLDDYYKGELHLSLDYRQNILETLETLSGLKLEVCGEPGMECTGCLSKKDLDILKVETNVNDFSNQRPACKCLGIKKELLDNRGQCYYGCAYCYWKGETNV